MTIISPEVHERQQELDAFILEHFGPDRPVNVPPVKSYAPLWRAELPDDEVIRLVNGSKQANSFSQLFNGDTSGYQSQSEADLALCNILAFWTAKNEEQMDRLFRCSGLYRQKWDQPHGKDTYGRLTIEKAISGCSETYSRRHVVEQANGEVTTPGNTSEKEPGPKNGKKRSFSLIQISKIVTTPADWIVQDFLTADSLCMFFSDPGGCKTFLAVSVGCSVATGQTFYGRKTKQRPVVFIAGEGLPGLKKRFDAWSIRHQVSLEHAPLYISTTPAAFLDAASVADVMAAIDSIVQDQGYPGLIVIDTLARNFGPGDENATADMGVFIQAADQVREKYHSAVLLIHHTGHGDKSRARGAMALKGALDFEYRLDRGGDDVIRVDCTKCKDFEPPPPMAFRLRSVELPFVIDEHGRPVTSAILDATDYQPPVRTTNTGRGKNQTRALEALQALFDYHRANIKEDGRDPAGARVTVDEWQLQCKLNAEMPRNRFKEVCRSLEEAGVVAIENGFVSLCRGVRNTVRNASELSEQAPSETSEYTYRYSDGRTPFRTLAENQEITP